MKTIFSLILFLCLPLTSHFAGEQVIKDSQDMDCHVYTPDPIDPDKTYQLVVGVHGAGGKGKGAAGMVSWVKRGDVIVIGPSFVSNGKRPYQNGDGIHAEKLIELFDQLKEDYQLRDKMFLHGFSGGSQFVHRFAMNHPEIVCGASAHSGGSWATNGYGKINKAAKSIPFAVSCGEDDTAKSFPQAPFGRLEWFKKFREEIDKDGFCYIGVSWPGVGHRNSPGARDLMKQCFQLATGLPGESSTEEIMISSDWKNLDAIPKVAKPKPPVVPTIPDATASAAFARADAETIPDRKLIVFMRQYPPVVWSERAGAAKLLSQCEAAAKRWHEAAGGKKMDARARKDFEQFSEGLKIQ